MKKERTHRVVIAMDSLKGSLSSLEAGRAIAQGIRRADASAETVVRPLADGGEGTVEALVFGLGGRIREIPVTGPLGQKVSCRYGILEENHTAVMEAACACGLTLVPEERRNPLYTTTRGIGEMIRDAISQGCRRFLIGIGGSATNDGGAGMLQALGFDLLDETGREIPGGAIGLRDLYSIRDEKAEPLLRECRFQIACDVSNPLCGPEGASAVYGPQKGASKEDIALMDEWLSSYSKLTERIRPEADADYPGSGAAGGLGYAFHSFLNAQLASGVSIVIRETSLEEYVKSADLVITGEGRLDSQTVMGKAPIGVAALAGKYGVPVVALAGCLKDPSACNEHGIAAYFSILNTPCTAQEAMNADTTRANLADTAEQVYRLFRVSGRTGEDEP